MKMTNNQNSFKTFLSLPRVTNEYLANPILWFSELTKTQFKEWFCFSLAHESIYPFHSSTSSRFGVEIKKNFKKLIDAFRKDPALPNFESYIKSSVRELFIEWSIERENISESLRRFETLIGLVGVFRLDVEQKLCKILNSELRRYRNKGADTEIDDATVMALKVLSIIEGTKTSIEVFKDYISYEIYAALCYRALYKRDINYAGEYFDCIFDMYKENESTMCAIFEKLEEFKTPNGTMEVIHHAVIKHSKRKNKTSIDRPWVLSLKKFLKPKEYDLKLSKKEQVKDQIFVSHGSECLTEDVQEELRYYDNSPDHGKKVIEEVDSYFRHSNVA